MLEKLSSAVSFEQQNGKVRLSINDVSTNWLMPDDLFLKRIESLQLNPAFLEEHLALEIKVKNVIDVGIEFSREDKPSKAIEMFDKAIYYDEHYGWALINKSYALRKQKHFVKSLRHYKKAVRADESLKNNDYYKLLLKEANNERNHFPKIKLNIYMGDEYFTNEEYEKALNSYKKALKNQSKFKDKILFKLLNKAGTAYLKLNDYENALDCFKDSIDKFENDYAYFGCGICQYNLDLDVSDKFKKSLNLSKSQQLNQIIILNKLGFFKDSLKICDELSKNHFAVDDFYLKLINEKMHAMKQLNLDVSALEKVLEKLDK